MNKQALIKLAKVRLAINHVLRSRLEKRAGGAVHNYVNPGEPGYDPQLGAVFNGMGTNHSSKMFEPYDTLNPPQPFYKRYPFRNTSMDLTPKTVSNPAVNPYINDSNMETYKTEMNNGWLDTGADKLHRKLFGLPSPRKAVQLDKHNQRYNQRNVATEASIPSNYFQEYTVSPLYEQASEAVGPEGISVQFRGDPLTYKLSRLGILNGDIQQNSNGGYYTHKKVWADDGIGIAPRELDVPLSPQMASAIRDYQDAQAYWDSLDNQAIDTENIYVERTRLPGRNTYRNKRNQLMHSYINQSPVGQAFALHPSVMTGVPYAAYHAMPYLWQGNQPTWMQKGINTAKKLYSNVTGYKSPRQIAEESRQLHKDKRALRNLRIDRDAGFELTPEQEDQLHRLLKQFGEEQ